LKKGVNGMKPSGINFAKTGVQGKPSAGKAAKKNAESLQRVQEWAKRVKSHL